MDAMGGTVKLIKKLETEFEFKNDGTLVVTTDQYDRVKRVLIEDGKHETLFYADGEITYRDCAQAMMKMWIDNVLTDGEYNRIMDKLNKWRMEVDE